MTLKEFCYGLVVRLALWSLSAVIVMWTWNGSVVELIDARPASWRQALGLVLLVQFLTPYFPKREKKSE